MKVNGERLINDLRTLREFTDTPGEFGFSHETGCGVTRFSYGAQDEKARLYLINEAEAMGCKVFIDPLQNIVISLGENIPGRQGIVIGSHVDTVRNGGWLDGILGVTGGLEVLRTIHEMHNAKASNGEPLLDKNLYLVIFAEEEGSNFGSTMTGSKFIIDAYKDEDLDHLVDDAGKTLHQRLVSLPKSKAYKPVASNETGIGEACHWNFDAIDTMLELHIEQGPVLERTGNRIGVVDYIFGMQVITVTIDGVGNHAGACPMEDRHDALTAACEAIIRAEQMVKPDGKTVVTVGRIAVEPDCSNVVPGKAVFTLEVRDSDDDKITSYMNRIIKVIESTCKRRGVGVNIERTSSSKPLGLTQRVKDVIEAEAAKVTDKYIVMDSGAVHDACMIANFVDTGMIFVPSIDGRSHTPEEDTALADIVLGAQVLLNTVLSL